MSTRGWAARLMARSASAVVAAGLLGMLGFVLSLFLLSAGCLSLAGALGGVTLSLGLYGSSLLIGHLSDPGRAETAGQRATRAQPAARQVGQIPRSSWM